MIYAFHPIHTANLNAIKAMGRSDIFLKLEIVNVKDSVSMAVRMNDETVKVAFRRQRNL